MERRSPKPRVAGSSPAVPAKHRLLRIGFMVVAQKPQSDSLAAQLVSLVATLREAPQSKVTIDLSQVTWAHPLLVLPLSIYVHETGSAFSNCQPQVESYLKTVRFPHGITTVTDFLRAPRNYIPIGRLIAADLESKEKLSTQFDKIIFEALSAVPGSENAVYYPISELVTNIFEHSRKDEGWIFAQKYPKKNYLDICIADSGRGLAESYRDEKGLSLSDGQAIVEALSGNSTKAEVERGYGLRTSKRIVCEALSGSFVIVSGGSALIQAEGKENLVDTSPFFWKGVIVSYRIPRPIRPIDIYPFLE